MVVALIDIPSTVVASQVLYAMDLEEILLPSVKRIPLIVVWYGFVFLNLTLKAYGLGDNNTIL
jgi:hypothetical protein